MTHHPVADAIEALIRAVVLEMQTDRIEYAVDVHHARDRLVEVLDA